MNTNRIRPFSNGQIENALSAANMDDGTIKHSLAERMGYFATHDENGLGPFLWACPEAVLLK